MRCPTRMLLVSVLIVPMLSTIVRGQTYAELIASGFNRAVGLATPPGDASRGFVIEQDTGRIRVVDLMAKTILPEPLLVITDLATNHPEQGLLGLTFDPDFANNGYFYVNYTTTNKDGVVPPPLWHENTHVERYTMMGDPMTSNVADPDSVHTILRIEQPQRHHNAGWMDFGPNDGYMYIATGDGGFCLTSHDPSCAPDRGPGHTPDTGNAQDITDNLLGKVLRLDVHGDDFPDDPLRNYSIPAGNPFVGTEGDDEIWAYGLRNPWRNGFDRETGDLWIGDVGANSREEVNYQPADWPGGANYGWRLREGNGSAPVVGGPAPPNHVPPVYDYRHNGAAGIDPDFTGNAVIGGYVYRGSVDEFVGHYFFTDYVSPNIWKLDPHAVDVPSSVTKVNGSLMPDDGSIPIVTSFGEDANGELYLVGFGRGNSMFRVATTSRPAVWNGDDATAGAAGNGSGWNDGNNWTRDGAVDAPFLPDDPVYFVPGSSQQVVDLEGDQTIAALEFHAPFTLQNNTLRVLSGNVTVAAGVVATVESELAAESTNHSIRKLGAGTLLIEGNSGQMAVLAGAVGGNGTFDHLTAKNGSAIAPGASIGTLQVTNSLTLLDGSTLEIEIGGAAESEFDRVEVGGAANLEGGGLRVSLVDLGNGLYGPGAGDSFDILVASDGINDFGETILPGLDPGLQWSVSSDATTLALNVEITLPGDYNLDGVVNAPDYVVWRNTLGNQVVPGSYADGGGDGTVNGEDYDVWVANFGATLDLESASGNDAVVPEPTSAMLVVLGLLLSLGRESRYAGRESGALL